MSMSHTAISSTAASRLGSPTACTAPSPPSVVADPPRPTMIPSGPRLGRDAHQLAGAPGVGVTGSFPSAPPDQVEPRGRRGLHHRELAGQAPAGGHRAAVRAMDLVEPVGAAEHVQQAFAAVGERDLVDVPAGLPGGLPDRRGELGARAVPRNLSGAATTRMGGSMAHATRSAHRVGAPHPPDDRRGSSAAAGCLVSWTVSNRPILLLSNRGPISFRRDDRGELPAVRGAGGLVSGLSPLLAGPNGAGSPPLTDDDRRGGAGSGDHRPRRRRRHTRLRGGHRRRRRRLPGRHRSRGPGAVVRDRVQRHALVPPPRPVRPGPPTPLRHPLAQAWEAYRRVNRAFADVVAESRPRGAAVLVQDYHLALVAPGSWPSAGPTCASSTSATPRSPPPTPGGCCPPTWPPRAARRAWPPTTPAASTPQRWADAFTACCTERWAWPRHRPSWPRSRPIAADIGAVAAAAGACRTPSPSSTPRVGDRSPHRAGRPHRALEEHRSAASPPSRTCSSATPSGADRSCSARFVYPSREGLPDTSPTARRSRRRPAGQRAVGRRRAGPRSCSTPPTTSLARSPPCAVPTSSWSTRSATGSTWSPRRARWSTSATACWPSARRPACGTSSARSPARSTPTTSSGTADVLHELPSLERRRPQAAPGGAPARRGGQRTPADWLADQLAAAD